MSFIFTTCSCYVVDNCLVILFLSLSSRLSSHQVQAQLLQFAAKNIGLNPALLTSPINPQQMTLLYQLQQLQMVRDHLLFLCCFCSTACSGVRCVGSQLSESERKIV